MSLNKKPRIIETSPYFDGNSFHEKTNKEDDGNTSGAEKLLKIENDLSKKLNTLQFGPPIEYIYNPLEYASELHALFVKKYFTTPSKKIMFLGMNPGPWGMSQTGVCSFWYLNVS